MGEPASSAFVAALGEAAASESAIARVIDVWTVQVGPNRIVATMRLELRAGSSATGIAEAVQRLEDKAKATFEEDVVLFIKPVKA